MIVRLPRAHLYCRQPEGLSEIGRLAASLLDDDAAEIGEVVVVSAAKGGPIITGCRDDNCAVVLERCDEAAVIAGRDDNDLSTDAGVAQHCRKVFGRQIGQLHAVLVQREFVGLEAMAVEEGNESSSARCIFAATSCKTSRMRVRVAIGNCPAVARLLISDSGRLRVPRSRSNLACTNAASRRKTSCAPSSVTLSRYMSIGPGGRTADRRARDRARDAVRTAQAPHCLFARQ